MLGRADYADDLREAVRLVPADPPSPARARVLEALAHDIHAPGAAGTTPSSGPRAEEAVAVARQAGEPATEAAALVTLACAQPLGGDVEPVRALLAEARAVATRARAYQPLLRAAITESDMLEGTGPARAGRRGGPGRDRGRRASTGWPGPPARSWPSTWPSRWSRWAGGTRPARSSSGRCSSSRRCWPASLWRLAGDIALARGDLAAAAESVASIKAALDAPGIKDEHQLPLARLETEVRLAQGRPAEALAVVEDALDRFDVRQQPPVRLAAAGRRRPGVRRRGRP